ncbi:hypothetical protein Tco_1241956, partial [Tanacetum coccineum]
AWSSPIVDPFLPDHQDEVIPDLLEKVKESWVDLQGKHRSQHHKDYLEMYSKHHYLEYE